jgi:hypothetical protein
VFDENYFTRGDGFLDDLIIALFWDIDNFCIELEDYKGEFMLGDVVKGGYFPKASLALSEVMTIAAAFHLSGYRTFKRYYLECVCLRYPMLFHRLPSYNRFVELMKLALAPMAMFLCLGRRGECTGVSFVDSTKLVVCDNHRIKLNKVFKDYAKRGKGSMGWFHGFKLHLLINDMGEIVNFFVTPGNVDDRNEEVMDALAKGVFGKLIGDKG